MSTVLKNDEDDTSFSVGADAGSTDDDQPAPTAPKSTGAPPDNGPSDTPKESTEEPEVPKPYNGCDSQVVKDVKAGDPRLEGHSPDEGYVVTKRCSEALIEGSQKFGEQTEVGSDFVLNEQPVPAAPPPPPDPADLAQQVISTMNIPTPAPHLGPTPDKAVVNLPLWLWIDEAAPLTAGVDLLGVKVTATATLTKTTWQLGEPVAKPGSGSNSQATVVCDGAGSPPPSQDELNRTPAADWDPACGHTFQWRSSPERTGGSGAWPVTATAQWTVNWTSNVGVSGSTTLETTNATAIEVLELKTRLVDNPDAPLPGR